MTCSGVHEAVIAPPAKLVEFMEGAGLIDRARVESALKRGKPKVVDELRALLLKIDGVMRADPVTLACEQIKRSLADEFFNPTVATFTSMSDASQVGRPERPRPNIMRKINDMIEGQDSEPIVQSEL